MAKSKKPSEIQELLRRLKKTYGHAECALNHRNPFELCAATILSAQCTDVRVNMVTPRLFEEFPDAASLARAPLERVEELIRSTGFFRSKAKSLVGMSQKVTDTYGGQIPQTMEELLTLPGVARKTANVVLGVAYKKAVGVVVDTHVRRISTLLGLTRNTDPVKIERDLLAVLPKKSWIDFSHQIIHHGREICVARRPKCDACPLQDICPSAGVGGV